MRCTFLILLHLGSANQLASVTGPIVVTERFVVVTLTSLTYNPFVQTMFLEINPTHRCSLDSDARSRLVHDATADDDLQIMAAKGLRWSSNVKVMNVEQDFVMFHLGSCASLSSTYVRRSSPRTCQSNRSVPRSRQVLLMRTRIINNSTSTW